MKREVTNILMRAELFVRQNDVSLFVDAIANLARVNRLTGLWDHVRGDEAAKGLNEAQIKILLQSEVESRRNVELRARHRREIDQLLKKLVEL